MTWTPIARQLDRRGLLRLGAAGAAAGLLAGCSGTAGGGRANGLLRVAAVGGGASAPLDPRTSTSISDYLTIYNVWDSLALLKGDKVVLGLAESVEPNADATVWTVRLRDGVRFHDGTPLDAADVVYSIRLIADPESSPILSSLYTDVDLDGLRALDRRTVRIPMRRPRGDLLVGALGLVSWVFPEGLADFAAGNGTGAFRLLDYQPGQGARLEAHRGYWAGAPALDGVEVRQLSEPAARLDAVRAGQVDYASGVSPAGAASLRDDPRVEIRRGGVANSSAYLFAMNVTLPPFDDPLVREAFRLAVDRSALLDTVLLGNGTIGNDVVGKGLPGYAEALPQRAHDPDRARALLAEAGMPAVTLRTAEITPGLVDAAELFAELLERVGVTCTVEETPADSYFADYQRLQSTPLQTFFLVNRPPAATIPIFYGSTSQVGITGYGPPAFDALLADAQATVDDAARAAKFVELQRMLHADGGDIVWGYAEQLDALAAGVTGVELTQSVPLFAAARRR